MRPKYSTAELQAELARLEIEAENCMRNYSGDEQVAMRSGVLREGVADNERMARNAFARINIIKAIIGLRAIRETIDKS